MELHKVNMEARLYTMNDEKFKKLFKWEGKKELKWILAFLVLFLMAYGYHVETKPCREIKDSVCYSEWEDCLFWKTVEAYKQEHPGIAMVCNHTTKSCEFSGLQYGMNEMNEMNFSYP